MNFCFVVLIPLLFLLEFFITTKILLYCRVFLVFLSASLTFFRIVFLFLFKSTFIKSTFLKYNTNWCKMKKDFQFANKNISSHQILIGISRKQAIPSWKYQPWCGTINFQEIMGLTYVHLSEIQDSCSESDWTERSLSRYQFTSGDQTRG